MVLKLQFERILAAVVLIAAIAVPSLADAHEGHAHHAPAVVKVTAPSPDAAGSGVATVTQPTSRVTAIRAFTPHPNAGVVPTDCAGHCCGGAIGMACCGAALAPDTGCDPFVGAAARFVIPCVQPSAGIPPETLPKPPKSFA